MLSFPSVFSINKIRAKYLIFQGVLQREELGKVANSEGELYWLREERRLHTTHGLHQEPTSWGGSNIWAGLTPLLRLHPWGVQLITSAAVRLTAFLMHHEMKKKSNQTL